MVDCSEVPERATRQVARVPEITLNGLSRPGPARPVAHLLVLASHRTAKWAPTPSPSYNPTIPQQTSTEKKWFCYNKIRDKKRIFCCFNQKFAAATKRFVDRTKHFVVTNYFWYPYFNKWLCWYNKTFFPWVHLIQTFALQSQRLHFSFYTVKTNLSIRFGR